MALKKGLVIIGVLIFLTAFLAACGGPKATSEAPTTEATPTIAPEVPIEVPFKEAWAGSAHADVAAEAFNHWNNTDPAVVPAECAKCHTTAGYYDYLGLDGSTVGQVDATVPAPAGVITCVTCHNTATMALNQVTFPSGVTISNLGPEARCIICHQGRESKISVDESIAEFKGTDNPDAVPSPITDASGNQQALGFVNIHYLAAAATQYGSQAHGGYEYDGEAYDSKNDHVPGYNTCVGCHDPHSLQVNIDECQKCHEDVKSVEDLKNIRVAQASSVDYDGDGNTSEGMYYEIQGMQETLMQVIQAYAKEIAGAPIAYSPDSYPYFFIDTNDNGQLDQDEATVPNAYKAWTPRLVEAAYNYQLSIKDPGAFAHGNKYIIQLLYDSSADLNGRLTNPIDMSKMHRDDAAHFAGNTEPFRHWDAEGMVPGTCAKCHSATGLPQFLENGTNIENPTSNGFQCSTCHDEANFPNRYQVAEVTFPSGAKLSYGENEDANLCIECHQGRESTVSVNKALAGLEPDKISDSLGFINVHYLAAGATVFGDDAKGAYEYEGKIYQGMTPHPINKCTDCHDAHTLTVNTDSCAACHTGVTDPQAIRAPKDHTDYDGDGNISEGFYGEIDTMRQKLYQAIQAYATQQGRPIVYSAATYPYFFNDTNANGQGDPDELNAGNGYKSWTPRLLEAAYNYQYSLKDPGAFVHNGKYVMQFLYDSIEDIGGSVAGMTRP